MNSLEAIECLRSEVIQDREKLAEEKTTREIAESLLHETEAWEALVASEEAEKKAAEIAEQAESKLREATLIYFADHPEERKPVEGVEVKIFKRLIYDTEKAVTWCMIHAQALLEYRLRVKEFEKSAEALGVPSDLLQVKEEPKVYLAKDMK